jgi:hypothetical protein
VLDEGAPLSPMAMVISGTEGVNKTQGASEKLRNCIKERLKDRWHLFRPNLFFPFEPTRDVYGFPFEDILPFKAIGSGVIGLEASPAHFHCLAR